MQDLIKVFTTYAGPDTDAQRNQYQRMLDLTRTAANACTGLYGEEVEKNELFVDLHLAELKALASSNNRKGIKTKYDSFCRAIQNLRNSESCKESCRKNVLATEFALLEAIHMLEKESRLEKLGYIVLLSIGIPFIGLTLWLLGLIELPGRLNQMIVDALPFLVSQPLGIMLVIVLPIIMALLVACLILRRLLSSAIGK